MASWLCFRIIILMSLGSVAIFSLYSDIIISVFSHSSSILLTVSQFLKTVFFFFLLKQHSDLLIFSLALWILCLVRTDPRLGDLWILEEGLYLSKSGICIPFDTSEEIHTLSISATSMRQTALLLKKITSSRGWLCFFFLLMWGLVFSLLWPMEWMHKLGRGYQCCELPPLFPWPTDSNIPDKPFHQLWC